jgi:hypothetical protein
MIQNMPGDGHLITLMSVGEAADERVMAGALPGYLPQFSDTRGSLWRAAP